MKTHFNKIFNDFLFAMIMVVFIIILVTMIVATGCNRPTTEQPTNLLNNNDTVIHKNDNILYWEWDSVMDSMDMDCGYIIKEWWDCDKITTIDTIHYLVQVDTVYIDDLYDKTLNAIMMVESRGNPNAYAPNEDAVGILQIRKVMVDDVNRILTRKGDTIRYTYNDRWNEQKSYEMFSIFCNHYKLEYPEEMARCWNGGPRGINNPYTIQYWRKVEEELGIYYKIDTTEVNV